MKKENKTFKEVCLDLAKRYNISTPLLEEKGSDFEIYNHYLSHLRNSLKDAELRSLSDSSDLSDSTLENEFERFLFEGFKFPSKILPKNLNESFKNFSEVTGIPFEVIFSCSLPILASSLGNSVRIKVKEKFLIPIFIWLGLIMKSGEGKTPLFSLLTEPLYEEQKELYLKSKKEREEESLLNLSKKEEKENNFKILIVNESTLEGLYQVLKQNTRGFLLLNMELGALLKSLNEYKKRGSDLERLLQLFDAKSLVIVRKDQKFFIPWSGVSILGGIQPEIFPEIFKKEFFLNGLIPRFLWIFGKKKELQIKEIEEKKYSFYKKLIQAFLSVPLREKNGRIKPFIICFNDEVKDLFIKVGNFLEKEIFKRTSEELRLFFFKAYYYYLPKFAGILKCLNLFEKDGSLKRLEKEEVKIDFETYVNSLYLSFYYIAKACEAFRLYGRRKNLDENTKLLLKTLLELYKDEEIRKRGKVLLKDIVLKFQEKLNEKSTFHFSFSSSLKAISRDVSRRLKSLGFKIQRSTSGYRFLFFDSEFEEKVAHFTQSLKSLNHSKPAILEFIRNLESDFASDSNLKSLEEKSNLNIDLPTSSESIEFSKLDFSKNAYKFESKVGSFWIVKNEFFEQIAKEKPGEAVFKISEIIELSKISKIEKEVLIELFSSILLIKKSFPSCIIKEVVKDFIKNKNLVN